MDEAASGPAQRPAARTPTIAGVAAVIVLMVVAGLAVVGRRSPKLGLDVLPPTSVPGPSEQPGATRPERPATAGVTAPPGSQEYATALLERLEEADPGGGWTVDWSDERVDVKTTRAADDGKAPTDEEIMKMCLGTGCPSPEAIRIIHHHGWSVSGHEFPRRAWDPDYRKVEEERAKERTMGGSDAPVIAMVIGAFMGVGCVVVCVLVLRWYVQTRVAECERLAPALGGSVKKGFWRLGAEVLIPAEGCTVTLSPGVSGLGREGMALPVPGLPTTLRVPYLPTTRLMCGHNTAWLMPRVKTGDRAFDADFDYRCNEPEAARAVFANEDLSAWLRDRRGRWLDFQQGPSCAHLRLGGMKIHDANRPTDPDEIRTMLGLLLESLRRLEEAGFAKPAPPDAVA